MAWGPGMPAVGATGNAIACVRLIDTDGYRPNDAIKPAGDGCPAATTRSTPAGRERKTPTGAPPSFTAATKATRPSPASAGQSPKVAKRPPPGASAPIAAMRVVPP